MDDARAAKVRLGMAIAVVVAVIGVSGAVIAGFASRDGSKTSSPATDPSASGAARPHSTSGTAHDDTLAADRKVDLAAVYAMPRTDDPLVFARRM